MKPPLIVSPAGLRFVRGALAKAKVSAWAGVAMPMGATKAMTVSAMRAFLCAVNMFLLVS